MPVKVTIVEPDISDEEKEENLKKVEEVLNLMMPDKIVKIVRKAT